MGMKEIDIQRPVRVLHLISDFGGGGSERWLEEIVRLSPSNSLTHHVVTIYPDYNGDAVYADEFRKLGVYEQPSSSPLIKSYKRLTKAIRAQRSRLPGRKLFSLPLRIAANLLSGRRILKALYQFRPDVIHAHTLPEFISAVFIKMVFRKPLIHTVPCLFSQMADSDYDWMPRMYRLVHPWVDYFSTGEARDELLSLGIPNEKILYDLCGVDLQRIETVRAERDRHRFEIRHSLGLPEGCPLTLSVGRLHPTKGHDFTIEAVSTLLTHFPDLRALILGEGEERQRLEMRARELGVDKHVHLIGFQPDPLPYYAAADVYLRTTTLEPENLSLYQAIAMRLPIAGFDTGWASDPIAKLGNGLLLPRMNAEILAEGIRQILVLDDHGSAMGEKAQDYVREHLDIHRNVSSLCSTYIQLANHKADAQPLPQ